MSEVVFLLAILVTIISISILFRSWFRVWIGSRHLLEFFPLFVFLLPLRLTLLLSNILRLFVGLGTGRLVLAMALLSRIEVNVRSIHVQWRFRHSWLAKSSLTLCNSIALRIGYQFDRVLRMVAVLGNSARYRRISLCRALLTLGLLLVHYKMQSTTLNCD